ncbi:MAG: ROK family protein [Candidatus Omnitrophica bacterium]|nr:ROK family protein [Candidatus Omnitrophota bacterium]
MLQETKHKMKLLKALSTLIIFAFTVNITAGAHPAPKIHGNTKNLSVPSSFNNIILTNNGFDPSSPYSLGASMGGTKLSFVLYTTDLNGRSEILTKKKQLWIELLNADKTENLADKEKFPPDMVADVIAAKIKDFLSENGLSVKDLNNIGVASTGMVNDEEETLGDPYELSFLPFDKYKFVAEISKRLGVERIELKQDSHASVDGEILAGRFQSVRNAFYIIQGTGFGGSLMVNGKYSDEIEELVEPGYHIVGRPIPGSLNQYEYRFVRQNGKEDLTPGENEEAQKSLKEGESSREDFLWEAEGEKIAENILSGTALEKLLKDKALLVKMFGGEESDFDKMNLPQDLSEVAINGEGVSKALATEIIKYFAEETGKAIAAVAKGSYDMPWQIERVVIGSSLGEKLGIDENGNRLLTETGEDLYIYHIRRAAETELKTISREYAGKLSKNIFRSEIDQDMRETIGFCRTPDTPSLFQAKADLLLGLRMLLDGATYSSVTGMLIEKHSGGGKSTVEFLPGVVRNSNNKETRAVFCLNGREGSVFEITYVEEAGGDSFAENSIDTSRSELRGTFTDRDLITVKQIYDPISAEASYGPVNMLRPKSDITEVRAFEEDLIARAKSLKLGDRINENTVFFINYGANLNPDPDSLRGTTTYKQYNALFESRGDNIVCLPYEVDEKDVAFVEKLLKMFLASDRIIGLTTGAPFKTIFKNMALKYQPDGQDKRSAEVIYKDLAGRVRFCGDEIEDAWIEWHENSVSPIEGKTILILGGGETGIHTARGYLKKTPEKLYIVDIDEKRVKEAIKKLKEEYGASEIEFIPSESPELSRAIRSSEIIVNATGKGKADKDESPLDDELYASMQKNIVTIDLNYRPHAITAFLRKSQARGARIYNGVGIMVALNSKLAANILYHLQKEKKNTLEEISEQAFYHINDFLQETFGLTSSDLSKDSSDIYKAKEKEFMSENRNERKLLRNAAIYAEKNPVNVYIDLDTVLPEESILRENIRTLARLMIWHSHFGMDIRYIFKGDSRVKATEILKQELTKSFGYYSEEQISDIGVPHTANNVIDVNLMPRSSVSKEQKIGVREYLVTLEGVSASKGSALPNFTAGTAMGISLAYLRFAKESVDSENIDNTDYEKAREKVLEEFRSIFLRYGIIKDSKDFSETELELMVSGTSDTKLYYALRYSLPPACKVIKDIVRYHEMLRDVLFAA